MKQLGIYKIRNVVNQKFYVGSSNDVKDRFRKHRTLLRKNRHHCKHLQAAWNKYGEECFKFEVVDVIAEEAALFAAEDAWLREWVGKEQCYNSGRSADAPMRGMPKELTPNWGKAVSPELRAQISETLKATYAANPENHPRLGKKHTEETKEIIRSKRTANPTNYWAGKERSAATRAKIGNTQRGVKKPEGRTVSEEGMAKIRAAAAAGHYASFTGKTHTEESKAKMSRRITEITSQTDFPSLSTALTHYGMTMPTLRRALLADAPITKGKFAGMWFRYTN